MHAVFHGSLRVTNSFDPRAVPMPGSTKGNGGVAPGSWAGSGDHPDTRAESVEATAVVVPAGWTAYSDGVMRITAAQGLVEVIDFYRGSP